MTLFSDERGQSVQVGAVLIFGLLIMAMSIHQAFVVPGQNREVEFDHFGEVRDDMEELRNSVIEAGNEEGTIPAKVKLGTSYPARLFAAQPSTSSGSLRTTTIGGSDNELALNTTDNAMSEICGPNSLSTRTARYTPAYNYLDSVGNITYENTIVYVNGESEGRFFQTEQQIIDGNTLHIYPLLGAYDQGGSSVTTVTMNGGTTGKNESIPGPFTLTLPTKLSASEWQDLTEDTHVIDVSSVDGQQAVNMTFESGQEYDVQCSPTGAGTAPNNQPTVGVDSGLTVGDGSVSNYDENYSSDTFSSSNGRWVGITCTDQLLLSDGQPASKPNGNNLQGDVIRLSAFLNDNTGENYTIDIKLARATDNSWNKKKVIIYDGSGNNVNAELTADAAKRIYEGGERDMLELSNYDDPDTGSGSFSDFVQRIQALEDDAPVVWQTSRMTGRVTVALECDPPPAPPASGVSALDGSTPSSESSALKFDIQVPMNKSRNVTEVSVTTPGNQNDNVQDANNLNRGNDNEVRLNVSNTNGVNQSGYLDKTINKLDGKQYELDTDAVFTNGAVLSVDMGKIDRGNTKWTYNLVDSESKADAVVTFYFQDEQFQVYLRVTNVNS